MFEDQEDDDVSNEVTQADFLALVGPKATQCTKAIEDKVQCPESSKRTKKFILTAIEKLTPIIDRLPTLFSPDYGPHVHEQLLELSNTVILKCYKSFQDQILTFYEILLIHANTINDWNQFMHTLNSRKHTRTLMKNGLDRHLLRLPRIIHRKNEKQLLTALKLLNGYLKYFVETNLFILTHSEMVNQIFSSLLLLFELEYPWLCLEESLEWNDISLNMNLKDLPWKRLKYVLGNDLDEAADEIIRTLQQQTLLPVIVNKIFDRLLTDSNASNELICLILRMLKTKSENIDEHLLIELILTEFLQDRHWYLQVGQTSRMECGPEMRVEELHFNVIHICLVIEVVSTCSGHLQSTTEQYLFNVIPKILEKAGTNIILIHSAALYGLELISDGIRTENVKYLIQNNADFISYYIGVRLKRDDIKNSLDMTNAFLELYSDYDDFRFIQGLFVTMMDLFRKSISDDSLTGALKITMILLKKLRTAREKSKLVHECVKESNELDSQKLFDQWTKILHPPEEPEYDPADSEMDLDKMKEEMENISKEEEVPEVVDAENNAQDSSDTTEEVAENVFLRELIRTLLGFISSSNAIHKLYALDAIGYCLELIDPQSKGFLSTVHLIWSPLATRFKETNLLVVSRTFDLLLVIARLSKDFIQKRASKEVIPYILEFLNKSVAENLENTGSFAST